MLFQMIFSYLCIPSFVELCLLFLSFCLSLFSLPICHDTHRIFNVCQKMSLGIQASFFKLQHQMKPIVWRTHQAWIFSSAHRVPGPSLLLASWLRKFCRRQPENNMQSYIKTQCAPSSHVSCMRLKAHLGGSVSQNLKSLCQLVEELR